MKSDGAVRAQNMAPVNPTAEPRLPEIKKKFTLILFKSLSFSAEDELAVLKNMFNKSNVESLTTTEGALLIHDLCTLVRFKNMGLKRWS